MGKLIPILSSILVLRFVSTASASSVTRVATLRLGLGTQHLDRVLDLQHSHRSYPGV